MIDLSHLHGRRYGVMGLGRSGRAAAAALAAGGAEVLAWDDRTKSVPVGSIRRDFVREPWPERLEGIVWSPGIPSLHPTPHPVALRARAERTLLLSDLDLLAEWAGTRRLVGITGTNGKSTTTALLAHLLTVGGRMAVAGGNIGAAALELPELPAGGTYVLELSSYQLELGETARFSIGIWLNLTPDHLDRHGGMHGYAAAKSRLWLNTVPGDLAIVGTDHGSGQAEAERALAAGRVLLPVSGTRVPEDGMGVTQETLLDAREGQPRPIARLADCPSLPGPHNAENAAAAAAAALYLGLTPEQIAQGLTSFPGLAHRQERVRSIGRVAYINDSKATNAESAAKALACYRRIHWIAGGLAKAGGIQPLSSWFDRISRAYLMGEAAPIFADTLGHAGVAYEQNGTLQAALAAAHTRAQGEVTESVVLLSPACASFDQWPSFEVRGDAFRAAVKALPNIEECVP